MGAARRVHCNPFIEQIYTSTRDVLGPPQLSRDGRAMYFSRRVTESDIWTLSLK
jgi:hypothetical protein